VVDTRRSETVQIFFGIDYFVKNDDSIEWPIANTTDEISKWRLLKSTENLGSTGVRLPSIDPAIPTEDVRVTLLIRVGGHGCFIFDIMSNIRYWRAKKKSPLSK
jgi:hypothetical protein